MANRIVRKASLATLLALGACAPDLTQDNPDLNSEGQSKRPIARFDLQEQVKVPFPIFVVQKVDLETGKVDGQLQIPGEGVIYEQINLQSGFTQLPVVTVDFSGNIDTDSIKPQQNFIFLGNDPENPEVDFSVEFDERYKKLYIYPQQPLKPDVDYAVILTKSIKGTNGLPLQEDLFFHLTKFKEPLYDEKTGNIMSDLLSSSGVTADQAEQLEALRTAYHENFYGKGKDALSKFPFLKVKSDYAVTYDVKSSLITDDQVIDHIAIAWAFHTSKEEPTAQLHAARKAVNDNPAAGTFAQGPTTAAAAFYAGLDFPTDALTTAWVMEASITSLDFRQDGVWPAELPAGTVTDVKAFIVFPGPVTGDYPLVIFQHGLGSCKKYGVLAIANELAKHGIATAGIDAVEHGERTSRNVDTENDAEPLELCDREIDGKRVESAEPYFDIDNLLMVREYLRQSVVDLVALRKALAATGQFTNIGFAGQSMGALLGAVFVGVEPEVDVAVLNVAPAWLSREFLQSDELGDIFKPKLAELLGEDDVTSETFVDTTAKIMPLVQGLFDQVEPSYFFADLPADKRVLIQEVENDSVSLNAGTEFLAHVAELERVEADATNASGLVLWPETSHGILLDPSANAALYGQMREQLATYLKTGLQGGPVIDILP